MQGHACKMLLCSSAIIMMSSMHVLAQTAPLPAAQSGQGTANATGISVDDIVVTATRVETNLQNTPIAVTALSSEGLRQKGVTSLLDIGNYVPSLSIGSRSGTGAAGGGIAIRGMGVDATDSSAAVGTYIDEVYFASGRGNLLGLMDVDRVEVLRGPQGTLFGRNTIAGAIQYVTHAPDNQFGGYITGTLGNFDRTDVEGALNLPLTDTLAIRVAGKYNDRDGYVRDLLNDIDRGSDRTWAARIKLRWTPTDRLSIDLKGEYLNQRSNGRAVMVDEVNPNAQFVGLAQLFGETRPLDNRYLSPAKYVSAGFNGPDYFRFHSYLAQGIIAYELSDDLTVKSITAKSWYHSRFAQDLDNTPLAIISILPAGDDSNVFTQELQLNGDLVSNRLHFTLGGYYYDSKQRQDPGMGIQLGFGPVMRPYGKPALDVVAKALYGQATFDLTDRLSVAAGLRYSNEKNTSFLIDQTSPVSASFSNWSPHAGLNFQIDDDLLVYAKASRGFRAGGISPNAALPNNGLAFGPETAWTYEIGARMQFLDRRIRLNPAIFMTDWKNIQFNKLVPTPAGIAAVTDNAGDARIKGFELEAQVAATERLQLTGSMSVLDSHYTRVSNLPFYTYPFGYLASFPDPVTGAVLPGSTVILPNITTDTPLQRAPKFKFAVGARYTYPLDNGSKLLASADYAWTGTQYAAVTISDQVKLPSYGVLNARLQYTAPEGRFSVAVFGTNITDKFYLIGGSDFAGGFTTGSRELDPARPREYGVEVRFNF